MKRRNYKAISLKLFMTLLFLAFLEYLSPRLLPGIYTYDYAMTNWDSPFPMTYSNYLPFTLPPNQTIIGAHFGSIVTNPLGYRGSDPKVLAKTPGTSRILFVGDSFTLGWGVADNESFVGRLRTSLVAQNLPVEVINAAYHDGRSPDAYYAYLKREGIALHPDLVVVVVYTGNDIDDIATNQWVTTDELGAPLSLYTRATLSDYTGRILNPDVLPWNYHIPVLQNERYFLFFSNIFNIVFLPKIAVHPGLVGQKKSEDQAWKEFETVTRATAQFCQQEHIQLAYMVIALPGMTAEQDPYGKPVRQLIEHDLKLPYLSTYNILTKDLQIPDDGHPTSEGHRLIYEALQKFLRPYLRLEF